MGRVHPWLWSRAAPHPHPRLCRSMARHAQGTPQVTCHLGGAGRKVASPRNRLRVPARLSPSLRLDREVCVGGGRGWMDGWVGRGTWGRRPGPRVLFENNNSRDLGAYTFKAGPAPRPPARPPARPSVRLRCRARSWRWAP